MNTCGTCKYFSKEHPISYWDDETDYADVTRIHKCDLLEHLNTSKNRKLALTVPAGVIDGSGYYAALCVSEDFGCNQWQPNSADGRQ